MRAYKKFVLTVLIATLSLLMQPVRAELEFNYFGQTTPGNKAVIFAPGIISLPDRGEV